MLEFGIDEITLVLQLSPERKAQLAQFAQFDWCDIAEDIISRFVLKSAFKTVFGAAIPQKRPPKGYATAYAYGEHDFYLAVAYHPDQMTMGVVVKFSAQALDFYCETSGLKVHEFLQKIADSHYTVRLSRIDLTADYIDEDINVTTICQSLIDKKIGVFREYVSEKTGEPSYRRCEMQHQGILKGEDVQTLYIGSSQSISQLRIYDKKREQIERNGSKLDKAKECQDWVRFEGVFRHDYAHQISDKLLTVNTDDELANLIACTMTQKFRLMNIENGVVDCDTEYTQMLLDAIANQNFALRSPTSRNFDLANSIAYLLKGSGAMSTLYKILQLWGDDGLAGLSVLINEQLAIWTPNTDCRHWLYANQRDYLKNYPDFDSFLRENVLPTLP